MTTLELALTYASLGISIIPLACRTKIPHAELLLAADYKKWDPDKNSWRASWEAAQERIASLEIIKRWFAKDEAGVALVGGAVSGFLVYLDFDDPEGYRTWALDHKAQVNRTAVQRTAHGYHVFVRTEDTKTGNMYYKGRKMGQVKGEGGYVVCPPSWHPEGVQYRWLRQPEEGILIVGSLADLDLTRQAEPVNNNSSRRTYRPNGREAEWARGLLRRLARWRADDYETCSGSLGPRSLGFLTGKPARP